MEQLKENKIVSLSSVSPMTQLTQMNQLCESLLKTPHYKKMGSEGIFAIVQKANSLGLDPFDALNGGLYIAQGKVMMPSETMNRLVRLAGHSIVKDIKSDDKICILHGKRVDNGDTFSESFSIDDAKRAGIYKENSPWGKYPKAMLFARALSMLARQLFPDVICGCYVEGEIPADVTQMGQDVAQMDTPAEVVSEQQFINEEQMAELSALIGHRTEFFDRLHAFYGEMSNIPASAFGKLKANLMKQIEKEFVDATGQ